MHISNRIESEDIFCVDLFVCGGKVTKQLNNIRFACRILWSLMSKCCDVVTSSKRHLLMTINAQPLIRFISHSLSFVSPPSFSFLSLSLSFVSSLSLSLFYPSLFHSFPLPLFLFNPSLSHADKHHVLLPRYVSVHEDGALNVVECSRAGGPFNTGMCIHWHSVHLTCAIVEANLIYGPLKYLCVSVLVFFLITGRGGGIFLKCGSYRSQ